MQNNKRQQEKKQKLLVLMSSVIDSLTYKDEFSIFFKKFDLTREVIESTFLDYNIDVHSHDNSIYKYQAIRIVLHIHNLIAGSWHIERQNAVCRLIKRAAPKKAIDLGFGVPSLYMKEMLKSSSFDLTLCDYQPAALIFAEQILDSWDKNYKFKINLLCKDMEQVSLCVNDYDLYIFLHSIEHVKNPTASLLDYVRLSRPHAKFLIELPIGPITPEHSMAWTNSDETRSWIGSVGLQIIDEQTTWVNPAVDLFAEVHNFNYGGHLMLCQKVGTLA